MSKPTVEYRTVSVTSIDPAEEPELQQQVTVTWDGIRDASVISDGDEISIVYTADTRKELTDFLSVLAKALIWP